MNCAHALIEPGWSVRKVAPSGVIVRLVHNADRGEGTQQTCKRGRVHGGGIGQRRYILRLPAEMVRETKLYRGVDLSDPAARQQVVHGRVGLSALGLVLRHFSLPNTAFLP